MTPRQKALALIYEYGAELDDNSGTDQLVGYVTLPTGVMFTATGCHTIAMNHLTDRPMGWWALLKDLQAGVEPCTYAECEVCERAPSSNTFDFVAAQTAVTRLTLATKACAEYVDVKGPVINAIRQQSLLENYTAAAVDAGKLLPSALDEIKRLSQSQTLMDVR